MDEFLGWYAAGPVKLVTWIAVAEQEYYSGRVHQATTIIEELFRQFDAQVEGNSLEAA